MGTCSNQTLWKILTGHASQRSSEVVYNEVAASVQRLKEGLVYYDKKPSEESKEQLEKVLKVKGARLQFILEVSKFLDLDQVLSLELFQNFLSDTYHGSLEALNKKLADEKEVQKLLVQLQRYLLSERRHLLRCIKHLYGFWQDANHPDREAYERCIELFGRDHSYIEMMLEQFGKCAKSSPPPSLKNKEDQEAWQLAGLHEQAELLEIILLYHKDYYHPPNLLLAAAKLFQAHGFGTSQLNLMPSAEVLVTHISHLCCLILVEGMDLEFVQGYQDQPEQYCLCDHLMLKEENKEAFQELDALVTKWGSLRHHAPVLLAWTVFRFVMQPDGDMLEGIRSLGKKALESSVFSYLDELLHSAYFTGDTPVSMTVRSVVHVLLSTCVTAFREDSLGDIKILIAIATKCFSNPLHRLEFWGKRIDREEESGTGLLLASVLKSFPLNLSVVLGLLEPLVQDESSAHSAFEYLRTLKHFASEFSPVPASSMKGGVAGTWQITRSLHFYTREALHLGMSDFVLDVDKVGVVYTLAGDGVGPRQVISWTHSYSAWDLFSLITSSILFCPGIGVEPVQSSLVDDVLVIAKLVTQVLQHNCSLGPALSCITQQYFTLLQKFSSLPHPPCLLLAECLKCVSVMAAHDPQQVWLQLSRTGFLPHINFTGRSIETVSVAPGYYGELMNSWERPRGIYPISMAMLDLLLSGFPPGDSHDMLACVVLVMREMFAGSHSWRYRHSTNRDQIGHKLLLLCHKILSRDREEEECRGISDCSVGSFVRHFLLYSVGGHSLLSTLTLSLDTVNNLYATRLSVYSEVLQVKALTLAFEVIDLLLQSKTDQTCTPLEQTLATQSLKRRTGTGSFSSPVHLVAVIASYVHHHDNPKVPAGATKLLTRLSQVSPMSVYACLGSESVAVRDAYIHRLKSRLEDTELKVAILELVKACVLSQPGMMELFLNIKTTRDSSGEIQYLLGPDSVLHIVIEFVTAKELTQPLPLRSAALCLLRSLWMGRHDAALIALRAEKGFWSDLTRPLFETEQQLSSEVDCLIPSHVMSIVAMEMYYIMKNKEDAELLQILKKFSVNGGYVTWTKMLKATPSLSAESALVAQMELSRAWTTFLTVGVAHKSNFHLTSLDLQKSLLLEMLLSLLSHLDVTTDTAPVSPSGISLTIALELSVLTMVLLNKWVEELESALLNDVVKMQLRILSAMGCMEPSLTTAILFHLFASLLNLLSSFRTRQEQLEPRIALDLIPFLEDAFKNHSMYNRMDSKQRPDILAVHLLNEVLHSATSFCLEVLNKRSMVAMVTAQLGKDLHLTSDLDYVVAIFDLFISISSTKTGAECLLANNIHHHLNITLASALTFDKEWAGIWPQGLQLTTNLLHALAHQYLSHALDFVGVYQEKLMLSINIYYAIKDLHSLEETQRGCQFIYQLSLYQRQWQFSMPLLHSDLLERLLVLLGAVVAVMGVSRCSTLKHIVKTMNAAGLLSPQEGPLGVLSGSREKVGRRQRLSSGGKAWLQDSTMMEMDAWVTSSPAYLRLQNGLVSILASCLATIRHYCAPLGPRIMEGGMEYPPLFALSLAPPTVQSTTPPSLGTLTSCLSTGLVLLSNLELPRSSTPTRYPTRTHIQKRAELLTLLEQTVVVLLAQASCYLADQSVHHHDKLKLKKELASELGNFSSDLWLNFIRKGAPSPVRVKMTPPSRSHTHSSISLQDSFSSGKATSHMFSNSTEQGIFKLADLFSKQFFELY